MNLLPRIASASLLSLALIPAALGKKPAAPPPPAWKASDAVAEDHKKGMDALLGKDWAAAEAAFTTVLATEPDCGQALTGIGRARVMLGKSAEAISPLQRATANFADQLDPHLWLARAYVEAGNADGALSEAKAAIALKPGSVDAQRVAQAVLVGRGDFAGAHAMAAAARAIANNAAWDCFDGIVFAGEGELGKAQSMAATCQGVPDPSLFTEFTRAMSDAVAKQEAAAPPEAPSAPEAPAAPAAPKK